MPEPVGVSVRVHGLLRGAELAAEARAAIEGDALVLTLADGAPLHLALRDVEGLRETAGAIALFVAGGDALELAAGDASLAHALRARLWALPEVTRALRAYGSRRGAPGSAHDAFFAPLVAPLRAVRDHVAADPREPWRAIERADAAALARDLAAAIAALAAETCPRSAPERRALEAELEDLTAPVRDALGTLAARAEALRAAPDDARLPHWHAWGAALADVFARADRAWLAALPALADPRGGAGRLWRRVLRGGGALALALSLGTAARAQTADEPLVVVRIASAPDSLSPRALVRLGFDVIPSARGERLVVVDSVARARLERLGAVLTTVQAPRAPLLRRPAAPDARQLQTGVFRSYDDPARGVRVLLDSIARASGGRVRLDTLGTTYEGRPILAAKLGGPTDDPGRPNVLFMATYHAREWAATEMALRLLRYLASPPAPGPRLDSLLARRDVWIVPVVNPDGYEYTFTTARLWRKNRRPVGQRFGQTIYGVDLNRNHAERWGIDDAGSSPDPTSEIYRGPSASSEAETQAIERFHAQHPPVVAVSYHTYAGLLLHPPGWRFGLLSGDESVYRTLGGTDERPAVLDRLPGAPFGYQRPEVSWLLYTTNGEYTDWASARVGTLSFTPEISSGYEGASFYGFVFPNDEARLQRLFEDNLPFALDVLESAADPARYASATTGLATPRVALESVSPVVRLRAATAPLPVRVDGAPVRTDVDALGGGRWQRRTVSDSLAARPRDVDVVVGADTTRWRVLLAGGAEAADTGWTASGFAVEPAARVGRAAWSALGGAALLRSPLVRVPADVDTLTVSLWTRYDGDGFSPRPQGTVSLSRDGGRTFERVLTVAGFAPEWYPESRTIGGVRGATVQLQLLTSDLPWRVDEIALVGHRPPASAGGPVAGALVASDNPVRGDAVRFRWPFAGRAGDLFVYDLTGRLVWRAPVAAGDGEVAWDVAARSDLANGAYLALARAGSDTRRLTLYVLRPAR